MPAHDHVGQSLPPAERNARVAVEVLGGNVVVESYGEVALSEPETRGLIGDLWSAWARAFDTGTGSRP